MFLSAGEASGDHYGAAILERARQALPDAEFVGLGGVTMERAGLQRVVRAEDVAVMGITEILRHVPKIYASYRRLVRSIREQRPDVAVLIDFPDVNFRLAKHLRRAGVPVVWFVSPQLWAWKRRRLRWVQGRVDRMLVIFPFEERFYRTRGVQAEFVGHPLAEAGGRARSREAYAAAYGLDAAKPWVALLPGSRKKEVKAHLFTMLQAAIQMAGEEDAYQFVLPVASTLDPAWVEQEIARWVERRKHFGGKPLPPLLLAPDAREALEHARASMVASGTATVLAAVAGNPFVVVYRVSGPHLSDGQAAGSLPPGDHGRGGRGRTPAGRDGEPGGGTAADPGAAERALYTGGRGCRSPAAFGGGAGAGVADRGAPRGEAAPVAARGGRGAALTAWSPPCWICCRDDGVRPKREAPRLNICWRLLRLDVCAATASRP